MPRAPSFTLRATVRRAPGLIGAMTDAGDQREAQTTPTFNQLASDYDAAGVSCFACFHRHLVEVATGILLPAAERARRDGRVVGIDRPWPSGSASDRLRGEPERRHPRLVRDRGASVRCGAGWFQARTAPLPQDRR